MLCMLHRRQPVELLFRRPNMMKRHTVHIALAATLFGAIIWISVSMREQYQISFEIPLTLEGVPEGTAVRTPVPSTIQLKLRGDGWRLSSLLFGPKMQLTIPMNMLPTGKRALLLNEVAEGFALRPGIQLVEVTPDTLLIELDRLSQKRVPVEVSCSLALSDGYGQVGPLTVTPDSVTLRGAESVLRTISSWRTERRTFENLLTPLEADLLLEQSFPYLITVTPRVVHIRASVEPFAEKVFTGLPVETRSVPANREVILVPPRIELVARAGIKQLSTLTVNDFRVSVDYATILADTTGTVDPQITAPAGVQLVHKRPDRLTYIIRKPL